MSEEQQKIENFDQLNETQKKELQEQIIRAIDLAAAIKKGTEELSYPDYITAITSWGEWAKEVQEMEKGEEQAVEFMRLKIATSRLLSKDEYFTKLKENQQAQAQAQQATNENPSS